MPNANKAGAGRKALPKEKRLSVTIQERVRESVFSDYAKLGGKPFLLEVIAQRIADHVPGERILATCTPLSGDPLREPESFDVTHALLALGKEAALRLKDGPATEYLRHSTYAPDWVRQHQGLLRIEVAENIARYFVKNTLQD